MLRIQLLSYGEKMVEKGVDILLLQIEMCKHQANGDLVLYSGIVYKTHASFMHCFAYGFV